MATRSLQSVLADMSLGLVRQDRRNLFLGGTSQAEMQMLQAGLANSSAPNFLSFLAGVAGANATIQEQRSQQFEMANKLSERKDQSQLNESVIAENEAQTKLANEQTIYYGGESKARQASLNAQAENSLADAGKTRVETNFVAPLSIAEIENRRSQSGLNNAQAREIPANAASQRRLDEARVRNTDVTTDGQVVSNRYIPQRQEAEIGDLKARAYSNRQDGRLKEIDTIDRRASNQANIRLTDAQSDATRQNAETGVFNANTGRIEAGIRERLGYRNDDTQRFVAQLNNTTQREGNYISANVTMRGQDIDWSRYKMGDVTENRKINENARQFDGNQGVRESTTAANYGQASNYFANSNQPSYNPANKLKISDGLTVSNQDDVKLNKALKRMESSGWANEIIAEADRQGVDPALVLAMATQESEGNPRTVPSTRGAIGLMQVMPSTAREIANDKNMNEVYVEGDIKQNIRFGVYYLKKMLTKYNGDTRLAVAAYNAGDGAVDKAGGVPNNRETPNYVRNVEYFANKIVDAAARQDASRNNGGIVNPVTSPLPAATTNRPVQQPNVQQPAAVASPVAPTNVTTPPLNDVQTNRQRQLNANLQASNAAAQLPFAKPELTPEETLKILKRQGDGVLSVKPSDMKEAFIKIISQPAANSGKFVSFVEAMADGSSNPALVKSLTRQYKENYAVLNKAGNSGKYTVQQLRDISKAVNEKFIPSAANENDKTYIQALIKEKELLEQVRKQGLNSIDLKYLDDYANKISGSSQ